MSSTSGARSRAFALAAVLAFGVGAASADDDTAPLRLKAYFAAKDEAGREAALAALEGVAVPRDAGLRQRLLREALARPGRTAATRFPQSHGDPPLEGYVVTPKGYDPKKTYPTLVSLHGRHGDGHEGIRPYCLPEEEWAELRKPIDEEIKKKGLPPGKVTVKKPAPKLPWEDGVVVAPTFASKETERFDMPVSGDVVLAALRQSQRELATDPDRTVLVGISLGAVLALDIACRRPDRFAGVVDLMGGAPNQPLENLRALPVYLLHGDKDASVNVRESRELAARFKELGVVHVFDEVAGMGHEWPDPAHSGRLRAWLRERVRQPWPKMVAHRFGTATAPRRVFWVEVPAGMDASAEAKVEGNDITLTASTGTVTLCLGEPLVDLEKEVVVKWGEKEVFRGKVARSWRTLLADLEGDGFDLARAAPARLEVKAP